MLEDHFKGVQLLKYVHFQILSSPPVHGNSNISIDGMTRDDIIAWARDPHSQMSPCVDPALLSEVCEGKDGWDTGAEPSSIKLWVVGMYPGDNFNWKLVPKDLQDGAFISVAPILISQGINEAQTVANAVGTTELQETINHHGAAKLEIYYERLKAWHDELTKGSSFTVNDDFDIVFKGKRKTSREAMEDCARVPLCINTQLEMESAAKASLERVQQLIAEPPEKKNFQLLIIGVLTVA